ncbi:MAG TPA: ATP-binding protein [Thermoanaerobaculia bacterium]|nr:ATP-binding protein [Thermoanaerobaculia bacterium]
MTRSGSIVRVVDGSEVSTARRMATQCAQQLGLSETVAAKAALIATELATNLVKHGGGGSILFGSDDEPPALTMTAFDKGGGIANVGLAMRDGHSTTGSPGTGLGAIQRAATSFDVFTSDKGTVLVCRIADESSRVQAGLAPPRITLGGINLAKPSETEPGDAWTAMIGRDVATIAVVDGLGHGPAAALAANAAIRVFREGEAHELERLLNDAHAALRATRGAAVGIARIFAAQGRVDFVGVGNIAGAVIDDASTRRVVSQNGIVGHEMRRVQTFSYPWTASSVLVLQSDGVSASWNESAYPGLMNREPALIAAVLYRDFCRGTDDATVVVAKAS